MLDKILGIPLGYILKWCYIQCGSYGFAIILFTLLTKMILFPISLWTNRNTLKIVSLMPERNRLTVKYYGDKDTIAEETQKLYKREQYHPLASIVPMLVQLLLLIGVIGAVRELLTDTESMLSVYPAHMGGITCFLSLLTGCSALALGLAQNHLNPLQREQTKVEQWMTNGLSIAISLALGAFVPIGVGIYWISSNLLTIAQQLVLNAVMRPEKYINYTELRGSQRELAEINSLSAHVSKEDKQRERADYKRFFSIVNKHLVFYSEKSGFYKYFQDVIEYLLAHSNLIIHYVTSDPKDQIFAVAKTQPQIKPYYIGEKRLITLMMKMDAEMVVMTTPDLDNFYLKRSYVRKDIEYIYMPHGMGSTNLLARKFALAHFDTVFCVGPYQIEELQTEERVYNLPKKNLVPYGYGLLDRVLAEYEMVLGRVEGKRQVLIAPSWHTDNILDTCIDPMLDSLLCGKYHVILRPHPEYCKRYPQKMIGLRNRYIDKIGGDFEIQTDFSSNETVFQSDIVVTDWSTICFEFSFTTKKPTLFVNTPMKIINPDYKKLGIKPIDIGIRNRIGQSIQPEDAGKINESVERLLEQTSQYRQSIQNVVTDCLYHTGHSGEKGGKYILYQLLSRQLEKHKLEGNNP